MPKRKKSDIEASLRKQLTALGAAVPHFEDLIDSYLELWDIKQKLQKDIKKRGIRYEEMMSTGVKKSVVNPAIKESVNVNKQMLSILEKLNLTTEESTGENYEEL